MVQSYRVSYYEVKIGLTKFEQKISRTPVGRIALKMEKKNTENEGVKEFV